jgi:hypothetical protein
MPATIVITRQPLDATQQGSLQKLFDSPAFSLLKEMVAAQCIEHQVAAMNAAIYPENEAAAETAQTEIAIAAQRSALLDLLDDLEKQGQEWWTVKLEVRR